MTSLLPAIDPLSAIDPLVDVARGGKIPSYATRTPTFAFWTSEHAFHLVHDLPSTEIDNDIAGLVAEELVAPGWVSGGDLFERIVKAIVVSSAPDPLAAWELFYRNTLAKLSGLVPRRSGSCIDDYSPVYCHAQTQIGPGTVLELGACFGFFSLLLAQSREVTASDVVVNTVGLLSAVSSRLGRRLNTLACDAARVPRRDASFDTVVALHLLEHMPPENGYAVLVEAQRVARRRVVIAVPFENEPNAAYGHVRTFDLAALSELGRDSGWPWRAYEHHGGWLILDRP